MIGCKNGISSIEVLASNGKPSVLYRTLEQRLGKQEALKAYLKLHSPEFKERFGDWKQKPELMLDKLDQNGEPLAELLDLGSQQLSENIKPEFRGKIIYAPSGTGKSFISGENGIVDADSLVDELIGSNPSNRVSILEGMSTLEKQKMDRELLVRMKQLASQGYTVLTPRATQIKNADVVLMHNSPSRMSRDVSSKDRSNPYRSTLYESQSRLKNIETHIKKSGKKTINLGESKYVSDILLTNSKQYKQVVAQANGADVELNTLLKNYLAKFGVDVEEVDSMLDRVGVDSLGAVDLLNKVIAVSKDKQKIDTLPEEAVHMITFMMGQRHPVIASLMANIKDWKGFGAVLKEYESVYNGDMKKVKFEAVGKFIAQELVNKGSKRGIVERILQWIKKTFELDKLFDLYELNKNAGFIVDAILRGDTDLLNPNVKDNKKRQKGSTKVVFEKAMKTDEHGAWIIDNMSKAGFVLTGSLALAPQGTIFRNDAKPLHDIDFVAPSHLTESYNEVFMDTFPDAVPLHSGLSKDGSDASTYAYVVPPLGYTVKNVKYGNFISNWVTEYDVVDKRGNIVGTYRRGERQKPDDAVETGIQAKPVDVFVYDNGEASREEAFNHNGYLLSNWRDIFKAKLDFNRLKDFYDFANYSQKTEVRKAFADKSNVMYQLSDKDMKFYRGQKMNGKQKAVYEDIEKHTNNYKLSEDESTYVDGKGNPLKRVSNFLFGNTELTNVSKLHARQGSAFHQILEGVVLGKEYGIIQREIKAKDIEWATKNGINPDEFQSMNTMQMLNFYQELTPWIRQLRKDNKVVLTEVIVGNDNSKIAGSIDMVVVNEDGSIEIYDLKTSINETDADKYSSQKWPKNGGYFVGQSISKREEHDAQQTMYARMLEAQGHTVTSINIVPYKITKDDALNVLGFKKEAPKILKYNKELAQHAIPESNIPEKKVKILKDSNIKFTQELLEDVRIFLEKRIQRIRETIVDAKTRDAKIKKINETIDEIKKVDDAKKVIRFIELAHEELVGPKSISAGFDKKVDAIEEAVENGKLDLAQAMKELDQFRAYAEGYNVLDDIFGSNRNIAFATKNGDSVIELLNQSIAAKNHIHERYREVMVGLLSKKLDEQSSSTINKAAHDAIAKLKERLVRVERYQPDNKKLQDQIKLDIAKYNETIANEGSIAAGLRKITEHVAMQDYWLSPLMSSNNKVLALFAKSVKKTFETIRLHMMKFQKEAHDEYKLYEAHRGYRNNVAEFNKDLYEERSFVSLDEDGNIKRGIVAAFVEKVDWNAYHMAKSEMYKSANLLDEKERRDYIGKWYKENNQNKTKAQMQEVIDEQRASLTEEAFNQWVMSRMYIDKVTYGTYQDAIKQLGEEVAINAYVAKLLKNFETDFHSMEFKSELTEPNLKLYYNPRFTQFDEAAPDSPAKRYYWYLRNKYENAQKRLPVYNRMGTILPSVPKSDSDRLLEQGKDGVKRIVKEAFNYSAEDDATMEYRSLDDNNRSVPVKYSSPMSFDDVSLNLISSITLFEEASLKYQEVTSIMPEVNAVKDLIGNAEVLKKNSKGELIADATAKKLGINDKYVQKHGDNLAAAWLESFIDMQIYGAMSEKETLGGLDVGKIADTLIGITAQTTIAWDALKPVANALQANVMLAIEGFAAEHVTMGSLAKAKVDYNLQTGDILSDALKPFNQSLIGQMTDLFDGVQGKFSDELGKTLGWSAAKQMATSKAGFLLMNAGEHEVQVTLMLAMMKDYKLMLNGKEIGLDKAYEIGQDGLIKLRDGVTKVDGSEFSEKDRFEFMNKLHAINKRLHGVYNNFDRIHLKRYAAGRLMMIFRNFLVPAIKRRYKNMSADQELGAHTEGFYVTFWKKMGRELLSLNFKALTDWSDYNPMEKANLRRFIAEMGFIVFLGALVSILSAMAEGTDDDDLSGYALHYALYQVTRVKSETMAYVNPKDFLRIMRSPSATTSTLERVVKLMYFVTLDPLDLEFERYERRTGKWEKGDLKLNAAFQKLFGLTGYNMNPEEAVKILNFNK